MAKEEYSSDSKFTAGAFANFFAMWLVGLVSTITAGIATPWILCWYMRFIASHTEINGKKLTFDGTGGSLFGNYIKWLLLSVITAGIYWLVAGQVKLAKWLASNTHLEGCYDKSAESKSDFTGKWHQMWGVSWVFGLLCSVTFGIATPWALCYVVRWYASHVVLDGQEMEFDGRGGQLVGKCILWSLLTVITFGIYSFWLTVKVIKWLISHIHLAHPEALAEVGTDGDTETTDTAQAATTAPPAIKIKKHTLFGALGLASIGLHAIVNLSTDFVSYIMNLRNVWIPNGITMIFGVACTLILIAGLVLAVVGLVFALKNNDASPEVKQRDKIFGIVSVAVCAVCTICAFFSAAIPFVLPRLHIFGM